jgi:hypothetical protein
VIIFISGLVVGALVYWFSSDNSPAQQFRASLFLYFLSYLLWGAAFFSAAISFRLLRRNGKNKRGGCCSCKCTSMYICGIIELMGVMAGFVTGLTMDGIALGATSWNTYYYQVNFTLIIGMPTVLASILCFGLPRVLIGSCLLTPKTPQDGESNHLLAPEPLQNNVQQQYNATSPNPPQYYNAGAAAAPNYSTPPPPAYTYVPNPHPGDKSN